MLFHHNHDFDAAAPAGLPYAVGDYYYGQDLSRDFHFLCELAAQWKRQFQSFPVLISGGVTSYAGTAWLVNVTAAQALADVAVVVTDGSVVWAVPPTTRADVKTMPVYLPAQTNLDIHTGGAMSPTADGATPNYLCLSYAETTQANGTRTRKKKAGTYNYERQPSYTLSCGPTDPTGDATKVLLATLTVTAGGVVTVTAQSPEMVGSVATPYAIARRDSASRLQVADPSAAADAATKGYADSSAETVISADTTLTVAGRYKITNPCTVTLPASLTEGQRIELYAESWCFITQADAQSGINYRNRLWTTKGVYSSSAMTGFMKMKPGDRTILSYKGSGYSRIEPPVKLADPATLPTGTSYDVAYSPNKKYLAVAIAASPYIHIYKISGETYTKLADPGTLPPGNAIGVSFSSDGNYLAVAHTASPYITIYRIDNVTDTFTKIADPGSLPGVSAQGCCFSADSTMLAVTSSGSPYITVYTINTSTDTFTKLTNPGTLPTGAAWGCSFSPDGLYLAVAHAVTPFVTIYKIDGTPALTKITNPGSLPAAQGYRCSFSPNGLYLAVAHTTTPFVTVYKINAFADTFTKLTNPATVPATNAKGCMFSPDSQYLVVGSGSSPFIYIYKMVKETMIKVSDPALPCTNTPNGIVFTLDGNYMAAAQEVTSPYLFIYRFVESITKAWIAETLQPSLDADLLYMLK